MRAWWKSTGRYDASERPAGSDLMQGTLTLPSFLLMENEPDSNPVQAYLGDRTNQRLDEALQAVRSSGVLDDSYQMARDFCDRAIESLTPIDDTADRQTMIDLANYILERRS